MNPLRALFLSICKLPPQLLLMIIIGVAVFITMSIEARMSEKNLQNKESLGIPVASPGDKHKVIVYSRSYIPAGSKIEDKQIALKSMNDLDIYDDAETSIATVVGATAIKSIPAHVQIRQIDVTR